jgi:type II secretory pathway pseudopilin PulG
LIVICILGILMGILFPTIAAIINKGYYARTGGLINKCRVACEHYRNDLGEYPWLKSSEVKKKMAAGLPAQVEIRTVDVLAELRGRGTRNKKTDYLAGLEGRFARDLGSGPTLVDAWGREIFFRVNPDGMEAVIWSTGRNGVEETNDGTSPDPVRLPKIYYIFTNGDTGDDKGAN